MNPDAWPAPSEGTSREPLPRVEDLRVSGEGYDQESVQAAFDSFYRHAAQLDAALRTLEAVDSFHRQAAALRADLRTLRTAGWSQAPFGAAPSYYGYGTRAPREGVSPVVWRILGEVALLVAVSVLLGVAKLPWWVIVSVMAGAFAMVVAIEWAASRDRWTTAAATPPRAHPVVQAEPTPETDEGEATGWAAFDEAQEPSDAMTIIGAPSDTARAVEAESAPEPLPEPPAEPPPKPLLPDVVEDVAGEEPASAEPDVAVAEAAVAAEASPAVEEAAAGAGDDVAAQPRKHWWQRRPQPGAEASAAAEPQGDAPRHVRILGPEELHERDGVDPWEQGFDAEPVSEDELNEPDEDTDEDSPALAADPEASSRRRFRRR